MGALIGERFFRIIEDQAEQLKQKEGNEINPMGRMEDYAGFAYLYSLSSLDFVLDCLYSFIEDLDKRGKEDRNNLLFKVDEKRASMLPAKIAFHLRGYVGVISEDDTALEGEDMEELQNLLYKWSSVSMISGKEQSELFQFILDYARDSAKKRYLIDEEFKNGLCKDIPQFLTDWVEQKLIAFKDVLVVSSVIVKDAFNKAWDGYEDVLIIEQEEKVTQQEYIDRLVDEKLQLMKNEIYLEMMENKMESEKRMEEMLDTMQMKTCTWVLLEVEHRCNNLEQKIANTDGFLAKYQKLERFFLK